MLIIRQIERLWNAGQHRKLFEQLVSCRPEMSAKSQLDSGWALPAAALALIRLNEYDQGQTAFESQLIRFILAAQEADGGWGDLMTTALCLRALCASNGQGPAIDRGMKYVANLQQPTGIWPKIPIRRMPADAYVSAFVLFQLIECPQFHSAVRVDDAFDWMTTNADTLDPQAKTLWKLVASHRPAKRDARRRAETSEQGQQLVWS
jgi:hypothetical protein